MVEKVYISFRSSFRRIGNNCNYCFLYDDNNQEREKNKLSVKKDLEYLASVCTNNQQETVKEALQVCNKCDYKTPSVFHFLDEMGIKF